jgi:hypothetical protein
MVSEERQQAFRRCAPDGLVEAARRGSLSSLGKRLRQRKDSSLGDLILRQERDPARNSSGWRVLRTDGEPLGEPPPPEAPKAAC